MKKTFMMERLDAKETPGCHRYTRKTGDEGCETIYLRKEHLDGPAPRFIEVSIKEMVK